MSSDRVVTILLILISFIAYTWVLTLCVRLWNRLMSIE